MDENRQVKHGRPFILFIYGSIREERLNVGVHTACNKSAMRKIDCGEKEKISFSTPYNKIKKKLKHLGENIVGSLYGNDPGEKKFLKQDTKNINHKEKE